MAIDYEKELGSAEGTGAAGAETIARTGPKQQPVGLMIVLGVGLALWLAYVWWPKKPVVVENNEQFNLPQRSRNMSFDELNKPPKTENKLVMAPPPAAAPAIEKPDDSEARRAAEEERMRLAEIERLRKLKEARIEAALRSPMLLVDGAPAAPTDAEAVSDTGAYKVNSPNAPNEDANRRFLDSASATGVEKAKAARTPRIDALIPQGTLIRATLETAVQSDLPGMVRAITTEDTYSFDGRRVLLAKGTMLTGEYRSMLTTGQTRVFMVWTRALRSDGVSILLGSPGADGLGRAGVPGEVDNHYAQRFGAALMLSVVGGGASYLAGLGQPATSATSTTTPQEQAQAQAVQTLSQTYAQLANTALKEQMGIPPTVHIDQGAPIIVFVKRDLDFANLYADPVKEALFQLKHPSAVEAANARPNPSVTAKY
jgi:type IV secretion system protein VirB10